MFIGLWLFFSLIVGAIASGNNRSFFGWFLLSIIFSPLLGLIFVVVAGKAGGETINVSVNQSSGRVPCDRCYEMIMPQATVCRFCGAEREPVRVLGEPKLDPERAEMAESVGYELAQMAKSKAAWLVLVFVAVILYLTAHPEYVDQAKAWISRYAPFLS